MLDSLDKSNKDLQDNIKLAFDNVVKMADLNGLHSIWNNAQVCEALLDFLLVNTNTL